MPAFDQKPKRDPGTQAVETVLGSPIDNGAQICRVKRASMSSATLQLEVAMGVFESLSGPFEDVQAENLRETLKSAFPTASAAYVSSQRQAGGRQEGRFVVVERGRLVAGTFEQLDGHPASYRVETSSCSIARIASVRRRLTFAGEPPGAVDGSVVLVLLPGLWASSWGDEIALPVSINDYLGAGAYEHAISVAEAVEAQ